MRWLAAGICLMIFLVWTQRSYSQEQEIINVFAEIPTNTPTVTPTPTNTPTPTPTPPTGAVTFRGLAYPQSPVTLLRDGQIVATVSSNSDVTFQINYTNLAPGSYIFALYTEDDQGRRSSFHTLAATISAGITIEGNDIFLSPTLDTDEAEVIQGEQITFFGQSVPNADITIEVNSHGPHFLQTTSDNDGLYSFETSTSFLEMGDHTSQSFAKRGGQESISSNEVGFVVGTATTPRSDCRIADLNCDGKVNLVDFSIAAFWYQRDISTEFGVIEDARLNGDGKVDLVDFSIMAYHWTG